MAQHLIRLHFQKQFLQVNQVPRHSEVRHVIVRHSPLSTSNELLNFPYSHHCLTFGFTSPAYHCTGTLLALSSLLFFTLIHS